MVFLGGILCFMWDGCEHWRWGEWERGKKDTGFVLFIRDVIVDGTPWLRLGLIYYMY